MRSNLTKRLISTLLIMIVALFICIFFRAAAYPLFVRLAGRKTAFSPDAHAFLFNGFTYTLVYAIGALILCRGQKKRILPVALGFALVSVVGFFLYKNGMLMRLRALLRLRVNPDHLIAYFFVLPALLIINFGLADKSAKKEKTTLYRKEKFYTAGSPFAMLLIVVLMACWIIGIMNIYAILSGTASNTPGFTLFGILCLVIAILWTMSRIDEARIKSHKKIVLPASWPEDCAYAGYSQGLNVKTVGQTGSKALNFYEHCRANGVINLDSEGSRQKALLLARNMKMKDVSMEQICRLYEEGKAASNTNSVSADQMASAHRVNAKRIEELNTLAEKMQYFGLHGREKRVAMLNALREEALRKAKEADNLSSYVQHTMIQKEHDWAVHGGIASGIAGPAAGVATALDIQQKNAAIRAQNEANRPLVAMMTSHFGNTAAGHRGQASQYAAMAASTKDKLMLDQDPQQVFANLVIENTEITVSETGAVTVEADFTKKDAYRIYETVDPTIDGTVAARLYQNGNHVASAYFVLPVEGVTGTVRLSAITTKPTAENANYTVSFEAVDLWAIERL